MIDKCTIFIPTYNRPEHLQRILYYYDSYTKPFDIKVVDSSSDQIKDMNAKTISSFIHLKITHLDRYPSSINPHHKFADMLKYADKKYSVICADDDFIVPHGIQTAISFLDENHSFTCAHGNYIGFKGDMKTKQFYWKMIYPYDSITNSDPKERFQSHLQKYYQTLYAVHRTDFFKMIYQELLLSKVDPMQFGELLPDMLTLIYGKMKRLDVLYAARAIDSRVAYWPTIFEYMKKGQYHEEYSKFKNCVATHLVKNSDLNENEAKELVDESMKIYLKYAKTEDSFIKIGTIINKIHLPTKIDARIKNLYKKMRNPKEPESWTTKELEYGIDDFKKIRSCVLKD